MSTRYGSATISTANTNIDGTGAISDLATGGGNGSRVDSIVIKASQDVTDGMIRFFKWDGSNWDMFYEQPVPETDGDALVAYFYATVSLPITYIGSGQKIGVSTHNAETFTVFANLWDY